MRPTSRLADLAVSQTAALFEGRNAGAGISMFVTRTPPGAVVGLHFHPYPETFLLLEGRGRWTAGDDVVELGPEDLLVVRRTRRTGSATSRTNACWWCRCTRPTPSSRRGSAASRPERGGRLHLSPRA